MSYLTTTLASALLFSLCVYGLGASLVLGVSCVVWVVLCLLLLTLDSGTLLFQKGGARAGGVTGTLGGATKRQQRGNGLCPFEAHFGHLLTFNLATSASTSTSTSTSAAGAAAGAPKPAAAA